LTAAFLASFLVLFLEVLLIRWLPAEIRLLAFFSNFILLASFLGIGLGCLLAPSPRRLFGWFPLVLAGVAAGVYGARLEVAVSSPGAIYFSSGTADDVLPVQSTLLLPVIFLVVVALFTALAQRMGREMAALPPLRGYTVNLAGSLAGVAAFAVMSWLELPPAVWFLVAASAALPLLGRAGPAEPAPRPLAVAVQTVLLVAVAAGVHVMSRDTFWSPYYKIAVSQAGADTVIDVNDMFHQSMAPVDHKEYFYQWPYTVFGDVFEDVLVLGAGSGTDVAAALKHGVRRVDAVEIDPTILRLGRDRHPDRPYQDPRVHAVTDDARHFLRTSDRQYDLIVFALVDSLTLQSGFSGVRLESYLFTREAFEAVRDRLKPNGLVVIYNYFRERWLVDRLANTAAAAFGAEPRVHVHEARSYLGVLMAGPRLATLTADPVVPDRVTAFGQSHEPARARQHRRDPSVEPAADDWPFLYLRDRHVPRHYIVTLGLILLASVAFTTPAARGRLDRRAWHFFLLGMGFMLLETKSITQFALLWGSTWVVASLAIASVLVMALAANFVVATGRTIRPWLVAAMLVALLAATYALPLGRLTFESRAIESVLYAALVFSPIFCAGLIFGRSIARSRSLARDYGMNLLGAMAGGTAEYLSLVTGFQVLIPVIGAVYVGAVLMGQWGHGAMGQFNEAMRQ